MSSAAPKTYAIVTSSAENGVQTIDVTDPENIILLDNKTDSDSAELEGAYGVDTFVIGSKTYAIVVSGGDSGGGDNGVQTIDVTDPENIALLDSVNDTFDSLAELDGAYGVETFAIGSKTYAIVTAYDDNGVQMINVTDPENIALLDSVDDTFIPTAVLGKPRGVDIFTIGSLNTYAIVASNGDHGVQTIGLNVDFIAPTPTITSTQGASGDSTNAATLNFRVDFGEAVTGFDSAGVTIRVGTDAADPTNFTPVSNQLYTFDVALDAAASSGTTVTVQIPANKAQDLADNFNLASTVFTLVYDITPPTVTVTPTPASPSSSKESLVFEIDFSRDIQNFDEHDLQIKTDSVFVAVSGTLDDRNDVDAKTYAYTGLVEMII